MSNYGTETAKARYSPQVNDIESVHVFHTISSTLLIPQKQIIPRLKLKVACSPSD